MVTFGNRTGRNDRSLPAVSRRQVLRGFGGLAGGAALLGDAKPGRAGDAEGALFHVDFESASTGPYEPSREAWGGTDLSIVADEHLTIVADSAGGRILEASFPEGVDGAGNGNGGGDFIVDLGDAYDELYCAYRIRFDEGFEFHQPGGKLPGLAGTDGTSRSITGGDDPDGENGWSARMMWRDPPNPADGGEVMFYTYHPDMPDEYGENMYWDDGPSGQVFFQPGEWHLIEHRVVMNTPGENDGILEGWFDGEKAFERADLRFRDVADLGIDDFYVSVFFGGGQTDHWAHDREEAISFDEFVVSTEPIWLDDDEPPSAPAALEATPAGETAVDLEWPAVEDEGPSGLGGYRVYHDGRPVEALSETATGTTVEGVIAGTDHEFAVSAVDVAGNESEPATAAVTLEPIDDETAPPDPGPLRLTDRQLRWVDVAWDPVADDGSGISHYEVAVDGDLASRVDASASAARVDGLEPGTAYEVSASTVDLAGNASDPATVTVETLPLEADDGSLVVDDFADADRWPGGNALGEYAGAGNFENGAGEVDADGLRLEYDDAGWLRTYVERDVSAYERLTLVASGDRGGEEAHVVLTLGDVSGSFSELSADRIATEPTAVRVDLEATGAPDEPTDIHLSFSEGGAGAVTIHELRFDAAGGDSGSDGPPALGAGPDASRPTDPDGDGLYDDVNGDGTPSQRDVAVFFEHIDSDAVQNNPEYFDFDGEEGIGFDDIVALFAEL